MSASADGRGDVDQEVLVGTLEQIGKGRDTATLTDSLSSISHFRAGAESSDNVDKHFLGLIVEQRNELLDRVEFVERGDVFKVVGAFPDGTSRCNEKLLVGTVVEQRDQRG